MNSILSHIKDSLDNTIFLLLFLSTISYWVNTAFKSLKLFSRIGFYNLLGANVLISGFLLWRWIENGYFPLSNLYESLMCLTWGLCLITLTIEITTSIPFLSSITTPVSMLTCAFATLSLPADMQKSSPLVPALKSNWLMMHVSIMMLSYSTLVIGSLLSISLLFLTQSKQLRLTNNTTIQSNPDENQPKLIQKLDNLSYRVIGLGFPLLTIGIIAGAVWANEAWGSYWSWDPKETWALITWLVFAAYLHTRITKSWSGQGPAIVASVGFVVVWICYLGVNFLGKGLHSYGWIVN
jgi:cytochrome c-type biogenesis protein CcsB